MQAVDRDSCGDGIWSVCSVGLGGLPSSVLTAEGGFFSSSAANSLAAICAVAVMAENLTSIESRSTRTLVLDDSSGHLTLRPSAPQRLRQCSSRSL